MRIKVTAEDIQQGQGRSCYTCPIARAINRALGFQEFSYNGAQVYRSTITPALYKKQVLTPRRVERFIVRFDAGLPCEPFQFNLKVEDKY